MEPEKGVVLHTRLPKVLTAPVAHHVEADQVLYTVILQAEAGRTCRCYTHDLLLTCRLQRCHCIQV